MLMKTKGAKIATLSPFHEESPPSPPSLLNTQLKLAAERSQQDRHRHRARSNSPSLSAELQQLKTATPTC